MKKNGRHLLRVLLSVLALTMLFCMPASAASKKTVATIGGKSYTSMASAVKAVKNGQTIKLQKDTKIKSALNKNKKYTINLNGHTLTGTYTIKDTRISTSNAVRVSAGTVTIKNGSVTGFYVNNGASLTVSNLKTDPNNSYESRYLYIKKGANVKIKSGSVEYLSIYNYGTLTINNITVKNFNLTNESSGKATIKGGTFSNVSFYGINNSGKLTISGGIFSSASHISSQIITNSGKLTISDGTFKNMGICNTSGDLTISGGKFTYKEYDYVIDIWGGKVTVKGGTFKSTSYDTVFYNESGTLNITGGTIKSTGTAENLNHASMGTIYCAWGSNTNITGGTISNKYSNGIYVSYGVSVGDGSFQCSGAKITVSSSKMKKICYED